MLRAVKLGLSGSSLTLKGADLDSPGLELHLTQSQDILVSLLFQAQMKVYKLEEAFDQDQPPGL